MLQGRSIARLGALLVLTAGCRTSRAYDRANDPGGRPLSPTTTGSLIITGRALSADPSRTVLDVIRHAMPQLRITGWTPYTRCPLLELRGKDSLAGSNDPDVYVPPGADPRSTDSTGRGLSPRHDVPPRLSQQRARSDHHLFGARGQYLKQKPPEHDSPGASYLERDQYDYCRPVNHNGAVMSLP